MSMTYKYLAVGGRGDWLWKTDPCTEGHVGIQLAQDLLLFSGDSLAFGSDVVDACQHI